MPPSPKGVMDWRGRLETHSAWWTLLAGVPAFVASALAVPALGGAAFRALAERDWLTALWGAAGAALSWRAMIVSIEALGQLWWRRLMHALAIWAVVAVSYPGWWLAQG